MNVLTKPERAPTSAPNYPLNCWWVAATAAEVTRTPLGRWLLDTPVVLFRTEAGEATALEDRCLHRWAPLSRGFLEGDSLICPYHGAAFGTDGACRYYPNQPDLPPDARIRAFAVLERGPFIWIWLGSEAQRRSTAEPPDFPFLRDPAWTVLHGGMHVAANYMLFHENLLDLTHFNTLHRNSLGITSKVPPRYWTEGNTVRSHLATDYAGCTPQQREAAGVHDPAVTSQEEIGAFVTPAYHMGSVTTFAGQALNSTMHVNHFMTPQSGCQTHYWWHVGLSARLPPQAQEGFHATLVKAFNEDSDMLCAIQSIIDCDPRGRDYPEISFKGDLGGIKARQALARILAS